MVTDAIRLPDIANIAAARVFEEMQSLAILLVAGNSTITSRKCYMPDLACPSLEENALLEFVRVTMPTAGF